MLKIAIELDWYKEDDMIFIILIGYYNEMTGIANC